jgi:hypothetical protein
MVGRPYGAIVVRAEALYYIGAKLSRIIEKRGHPFILPF